MPCISEILEAMRTENKLDRKGLDIIKKNFLPRISRCLSSYDSERYMGGPHSHCEPDDLLSEAIGAFIQATEVDNAENYFKQCIRNKIYDWQRAFHRYDFTTFLHSTLDSEENVFTQLHRKGESKLRHWWGGKGDDWETKKNIKYYREVKLDILKPQPFNDVTENIHIKLKGKKTSGLKVQYYSKYLLELDHYKYMRLRVLAEMRNLGASMPRDKNETVPLPVNKKEGGTKKIDVEKFPDGDQGVEYLCDKEIIKRDLYAIVKKPTHRFVFYLRSLGIGYKHIETIVSELVTKPKWQEMGLTTLGRSGAHSAARNKKYKILSSDLNHLRCVFALLEEEFGSVKSEPIFQKYLDKDKKGSSKEQKDIE